MYQSEQEQVIIFSYALDNFGFVEMVEELNQKRKFAVKRHGLYDIAAKYDQRKF